MRLLLLSIVLTLPLMGATKFVRVGGVGSNNGSNWANAWDLNTISWSSLNAGDLVCVAGGTYTSAGVRATKSGTAGNPITLRRAVASDPNCGSSSVGWSSAFDSTVTQSGGSNISVDDGGTGTGGNYLTFDGVVGDPTTSPITPAGWVILIPNTVAGSGLVGVGTNGPTTNVIFQHMEFWGPEPNGHLDTGQNNDSRAIDMGHYNGSGYDSQDHWSILFTNIHGTVNGIYAQCAPNFLIDHSRIADTSGFGSFGFHANQLIGGQCNNSAGLSLTLRYSIFENWEVEGILLCPGPGPCQSNPTAEIYGNIFNGSPTGGAAPDNMRFLEVQYGTWGPFHVYNNTFVNMSGGSGNQQCLSNTESVTPPQDGHFVSGTSSQNNMFWNTTFKDCNASGNANVAEDYSYSQLALTETHGQGSGTNRFVNLAANNFHLASNTNAGFNLGSPYNTDPDGVTRTTWSRGAFEFVSGGPTAPTVTTTTATGVTSSTATSGGNVTSDGGASVTSRGVCYSTSASPTSPCTSNGTGTGVFTSSLSGLIPNTLYHYRAFATNSIGTSYGADLTFTTLALVPSQIGGQTTTGLAVIR